MKKHFILLISSIAVTLFVMAEINIYVYKKDGEKEVYLASLVDSIGFVDKQVDVFDANGHEYVDLGLPSGTLWATMNVGAMLPEDYGDYFAWGEIKSKTVYDWDSYKWSKATYNTQTKYSTDFYYGTVDNKIVLDLADDVANAKWGGTWRMPTKSEQDELISSLYTFWTLITINGVNGYKVTSRSNGNSIFLPAAGYISGSNKYNVGSECYYWSNSLHWEYSYIAYAQKNMSGYHLYSRNNGLSVRPVLSSK